jgi:hypothetical protein
VHAHIIDAGIFGALDAIVTVAVSGALDALVKVVVTFQPLRGAGIAGVAAGIEVVVAELGAVAEDAVVLAGVTGVSTAVGGATLVSVAEHLVVIARRAHDLEDP